MNVAVRSDCGKVRANNQDSYLAENGIFAVADGMGGHKGGEIASSLAISSIRSALTDTKPELSRLMLAVEAANRRIFTTGREDPNLAGMGTTLSVIWPEKDTLYIGHVGDSRVYRFRDQKLEQLTQDHSYVWELMNQGVLTREETRTSPYRNIITRAVGTEPRVEGDFFTENIRPGDRYLLCSDGLCGLVEDETLSHTLQTIPDINACADALLKLALDAGGTDNITLLLVDEGSGL